LIYGHSRYREWPFFIFLFKMIREVSMKRFCMLCVVASMLVIGCGEAAPTSAIEGATESDVEAYTRMVAESQAATGSSDKLQAQTGPKAGATDSKDEE
jgi:hypothetical protein